MVTVQSLDTIPPYDVSRICRQSLRNQETMIYNITINSQMATGDVFFFPSLREEEAPYPVRDEGRADVPL